MWKWLVSLFERWKRFTRNIKVWQPCNVYPSAVLGNNVSIGRFAEVGHNVIIGEGTRIGKGAFIPEGVLIGAFCFIGPHVCFSNDMYPPSPKKCWQTTLVEDGARIGANVSIRPGVRIGQNALVGMGSVVCCDIPANSVWAGVPARPISNSKAEAIMKGILPVDFFAYERDAYGTR